MSRRRKSNGRRRHQATAHRAPAPKAGARQPTTADRSAVARISAPTDFVSYIPLSRAGTPVAAWLRMSADGVLRAAACQGCGARHEEFVARPDHSGITALLAFAARVLAEGVGVHDFATQHLACASTVGTPLSGCTESWWNVPEAIPARVRYWADELLDAHLSLPEPGPTAVVGVLARHTDGTMLQRERSVPRPPDDLLHDQMPGRLHQHIHGLITACGGRLEAVFLGVRSPNESNVPEVPVVASFIIVTAQGAFAGLLPLGANLPASDTGKDDLLIWQPLVLPLAFVDGLFARPGR